MTADARRGLKKCVCVGVYLCVGRRLVCVCECERESERESRRVIN